MCTIAANNMARSCAIVVVATAVLVATGVVESNSDKLQNGYAQVGVVDTPEVSEPLCCRLVVCALRCDTVLVSPWLTLVWPQLRLA
jgi:hypothetical protein